MQWQATTAERFRRLAMCAKIGQHIFAEGLLAQKQSLGGVLRLFLYVNKA